MESSETNIYYEEKESSTCGYTQGRTQRESAWSRPHGSLNHFDRAFLLGFLWPITDLPGSQSIFDISQNLPMCIHASLTKVGITKKAYE